jgi:hypothetical protein
MSQRSRRFLQTAATRSDRANYGAAAKDKKQENGLTRIVSAFLQV